MNGGRGAVITGGAGGLGTAIAHALSDAGYDVWVTDLDGGAAEQVAAEIGARARALDVTDAAACEALASEIGTDLVLWVNNAGLLFTGPTWEMTESQRRLLVDVNTHGTVNGTLAALKMMRKQRSGHVINIVSLAGLAAPPGEALYAATKHAALGFSLGTLADLHAAGLRDVHISAICPDGIWTPMLFDKLEDREAASSWSGTLLMPAQVAAVVARVAKSPRPVTSIPRWRGGLARFSELSPRIARLLYPVLMRAARRKQRKFAASHRAN